MDEKIILFVSIAFIIGVLIIIFDADTRKKFNKSVKKPIDVIQKKTADNDLDKKLERLQKLGQLYKEGIITKDEFDEQKKKIKL